MNIAFFCVLFGAVMPIMWTAVAKFSGAQKLGPKENRNPREWLEQQTGAQKRAHWAQQNAFEAFPGFAAGAPGRVSAGRRRPTAPRRRRAAPVRGRRTP